MENASSQTQPVRFGSFELDLRAGELRKQSVKIKLQEQPFQILAMLLEHPGQVVTREELRSPLWPSDTFVDFDHSLNKAINKLREALGDSADSPRFIETVAKRGYRFLRDLQASPGQIRSLLVLPLENLSRDPEQEYFADGLTDAQLIQASTDTHLWAQSYGRDLRDVLALQSEVARAVANEIQVKLTPQEQVELTQSRRVDPNAYEAYLKGRYHWNKRSLEGMSKGLAYFQQAIERDPQYAAAYAGLADSASRLGFWGHVKPEEGCARGITAALKTLELDNRLADAHAALGFSLLH